MRAFLLALGTRGDVELIASLGRELALRGHRVVVGTSAHQAPVVASAGIEHASVGASSREDLIRVLASLRGIRDRLARTRAYYLHWLRPEIQAAQPRIGELAASADYFVSNLKMVLARGDRRMPGAFIDYDLPVDLADLRRYGVDTPAHRATTLDLVAMSKPLVDPDDRWGEPFRFTGFWAGAHRPAPEPGSALQRFVESAEPPIVLTLGSMTLHDPEALVDAFDDAVRRLGRRGIVVCGWSRLAARPGTDRLRIEPEVPYAWLFPRAACVVHHGGTGTTGAALRAGTPSVLLPQIASQAEMARALARAHLAPPALDTEGLTGERLAEAIAAGLGPDAGAAAARWRERVQAEPGAAGAAELVERHWRRVTGSG